MKESEPAQTDAAQIESARADYDICVIGGGINGAGIARDAAGRGLKVLLVEAADLASATSSASTKLIHGGLRYLEYYEFHLVRASLKERERLLNIAPHVIRPMRFVLPHDKAQRPARLIRLGLFFYDNLAKRKRLMGSRGVALRGSPLGRPLEHHYKKGFIYTDCRVDDSRLVVLNAMSAAQKGADILTHTKCENLNQSGKVWTVDLHDLVSGERWVVSAKTVVNAAGPWVRSVLDEAGLTSPETPNIRLVKGSHIIINQAYEGEHAYVLQQPDKRIVFVMPYEGKYTLIGTTEEAFNDDPYEARISKKETEYLCAAYNRSFKKDIRQSDVLWAYSGVRPLFDDGEDSATSVTRDYVLHEYSDEGPLLLSVFGGKLTTYRVLSEQVVDRVLEGQADDIGPWTASENLPGGGILNGDFDRFILFQKSKYFWLDEGVLYRYARSYGLLMDRFLKGTKSYEDLGEHYGDGVYEVEIHYLVRDEWARTAEDILYRRSKLGLHVSGETVQNLEKALSEILKQHSR